MSPGWDCHGLPIEYAVVKDSSGLEPAEIRTRCEAFARGHIDTQRKSFRRLGVLGDWENPYLTLDPAYEADIIRVFADFIEKDLVYSSMKPVQWSYGAQTALAEAEVEYEDVTDTAVYVKFPIVSGHLAGESSLVIWTTTPWTLPANLGIALAERIEYVRGDFKHEDGRVENLIIARDLLGTFAEKTGFQLDGEGEASKGSAFAGVSAKHPFLDRESKVIFGGFVTTETGTGAVHIAPGHGSDDYVAGLENGLDVLSPVDDNGNYTEEVGMPEFVGKHVFESNAPIVEILREGGHLLGEERYRHSYPTLLALEDPYHLPRRPTVLHPYRCDPAEGTRGDRQGQVDASQHAQPYPWHGGGSPRLVHLPPAHLGSALAGILRYRRCRNHRLGTRTQSRRPSLRDGGTNLWFEKDDAWWNDQLGLPAETTRCQDTLDVWIDSGSSHVAVLDRHPNLHAPADLYFGGD